MAVYDSTGSALSYLSSSNSALGTWVYQSMSYTVPSWASCPCSAMLYVQADNVTTARFDDGFLGTGSNAGTGPLYYAEDFLGTSRVITQNNGAVCYDADFDPYGGEHPYTNNCSSSNAYKFEGKERDSETGNDDFGARYYTSRFGRWLSADWSSVPVPVPYANLTNPQTLNLYSMVSDDPESFADLDGHCIPCVVIIVAIAVGGTAYELHELNERGEARNEAAWNAYENKISPFGKEQNTATEADATAVRDARTQDMGDMAITAVKSTVPDSAPATTVEGLVVDKVKNKAIDTMVGSAKNNTSQQNSGGANQQDQQSPSLWKGFKSLFSPPPPPPPPPQPPPPPPPLSPKCSGSGCTSN